MIAHVASLHFHPVHAERTQYGGYYDIPSLTPGDDKHKIITVTDMTQKWRGPYSMSPDGRTRPLMKAKILGERIAADLVKQWSQDGLGMNDDCHPAVWVVREYLPETDADGKIVMDEETGDDKVKYPMWREATKAEKETMWAEDVAKNKAAGYAYANFLFREWNAKFEQDPRIFPFISEVAKAACRFFEFDAPWAKSAGEMVELTKHCQFCQKSIHKFAITCPHCQQVVDYTRFAQEEAKKQAAINVAMGVDKTAPVRPPTARQ